MSYHSARRYEALCASADTPASATLAPAARQDLDRVAALLRIAPAQLTGRARPTWLAQLRQEAMWLLRQRGHAFPLIARLVDRDTATVQYGVRQVAARMADDPATHARLSTLRQEVCDEQRP